MTGLLCQLNAFIDRRMGRNAIEMHQLVSTEAQGNQDFHVELCIRVLQERPNEDGPIPVAIEGFPIQARLSDFDPQVRALRRACREAGRLNAIDLPQPQGGLRMPLSALEKQLPSVSGQSRPGAQPGSAEELGGTQALPAFELQLDELDPCARGAGDKHSLIFNANLARGACACAVRQLSCDARSVSCLRAW